MNIDIFISHHTSSSLHIVEGIVNKLEASGLRCWYAPRDTEGAYAGSISQALNSCSVFLLILNKPASESFHVLNEIDMVSKRLVNQDPVHIIPFHIADTDISADAQYYLGRMHWIDAMTPPMYKRVDELVNHINRVLGRVEPTENKSQTKDSAPNYRLLSKLPQTRDVFYGRDQLIEQIASVFHSGKNVLFLEGIGGIGKSELAKQYALQHKDRYDTILFLTYSTTLEKLFFDATSIMIEGLEPTQEESEADYFQRKLRILQSLAGPRTLIIVDNFDTDTDPRLKEFLTGTYHVIFTTRNTHPGYPCLKVEAMRDPAVLINIFEENYGSSLDETEKAIVEQIFEQIEYHTYAVELIAKQMEASFLSAADMLATLKEGSFNTSLSETVAGRNHFNTAFGHICSVFNTSNLNPVERRLLCYLSLTGTRGIPAAHFKDWASLDSFEIVNGLIRKSWIRKEAGNRLSLHPLVKEVIHTLLTPTADSCQDFFEKASAFCYGAWYRPYPENVAVGDTLLSILQNCPTDSRYWLEFNSLNNFLWQIGIFEDSISFAHNLYDACLRDYGKASMYTGMVAKGLGGCYFNSGRLEESIPWYKAGLDCMLASGEPAGEDLAMSYEKVARCYSWPYEQDFAKAEELFLKALEIRQNLLSDAEKGLPVHFLQEKHSASKGDAESMCPFIHARIGETYMEMARLYQLSGDYHKALDYSERFLQLLEAHSPENVSSIAYARYDMGVSHYHLGLQAMEQGDSSSGADHLNNAETLLRSALKINMKMRGALALDTIDNQEYLADVLAAQGNYGAASNEYMAVITMVEGLLGPQHPRIQTVKDKMDFENPLIPSCHYKTL